MKDKNLRMLLGLVESEIARTTKMYGEYNSAHEGYAVLLEEVDELWDEVKAKSGVRSHRRMAEEAVQIASVAIRFAYSIVPATTIVLMHGENAPSEEKEDTDLPEPPDGLLRKW